jgi:hypothetical protein
MCAKKKTTKVLKFCNKLNPILQMMVELNCIAFFKIFIKNNQKFIFLKINKKIKIKICKNVQKLTLTKKELIRINKIDKSFLIISNTTGLELINPYSTITGGGIVLAKLTL